jgi:hypothetical protein
VHQVGFYYIDTKAYIYIYIYLYILYFSVVRINSEVFILTVYSFGIGIQVSFVFSRIGAYDSFSETSRSVLGPTQLHIQWASGLFSWDKAVGA